MTVTTILSLRPKPSKASAAATQKRNYSIQTQTHQHEKRLQGSSSHISTYSFLTTHHNIGALTTLHHIRHKSDGTVPITAAPVDLPTSSVDIIPEPPSAEVVDTVVQQLNALGEPALSSLGLCSYWPPGWIQSFLEVIHVNADMPWWATFAVFAVVLRTVIVPVQVMAMRNSIKYGNIMPGYAKCQEGVSNALASQDQLQIFYANKKMEDFTAKNGKPKILAMMKGPAIQMVVFMSTLKAIKGMANLPVESMMSGGVLWIPDLTLADPYMILPFLTSATLLLNLELGAEGMSTNTMSNRNRWIMRGVVAVVIPVAMSFQPAALAVYWFFSNLIAVGISAVIKSPLMKKRLNIPDRLLPEVKHTRSVSEGFYQKSKRMSQERQIKTAADNTEHRNAMMFREAGTQPRIKTFKYDPTKVTNK